MFEKIARKPAAGGPADTPLTTMRAALDQRESEAASKRERAAELLRIATAAMEAAQGATDAAQAHLASLDAARIGGEPVPVVQTATAEAALAEAQGVLIRAQREAVAATTVAARLTAEAEQAEAEVADMQNRFRDAFQAMANDRALRSREALLRAAQKYAEAFAEHVAEITVLGDAARALGVRGSLNVTATRTNATIQLPVSELFIWSSDRSTRTPDVLFIDVHEMIAQQVAKFSTALQP